MEFRLSFCAISEIDHGIFEMVIDEGVSVDADCGQEELDFWMRTRSQPYKVLLNCCTSFSYEYGGALGMGQSPLQTKIAVLTYDRLQYAANSMALAINRVAMPEKQARIFRDREEAVSWLKDSF